MFIKRGSKFQIIQSSQSLEELTLGAFKTLGKRLASVDGIRLDPERHLYFRNRAVSGLESHGDNENGDAFERMELQKSYSTFIQAPETVDHNPDDVTGMIIDSRWIPVFAVKRGEEVIPIGESGGVQPGDQILGDWVENIHAMDIEETDSRHPGLIQSIENGEVTDTSMGCYVQQSICSICGNHATTEGEFCEHIASFKTQMVATASGPQRAFEVNRDVTFFEDSVIKTEAMGGMAGGEGADMGAKILEKIAEKQAGPSSLARYIIRRIPEEVEMGNSAEAKLAKINKILSEEGLRKGDLVEVTEGGLIGVKGKVIGGDAKVVILASVGGNGQVTVPRNIVKKISQVPGTFGEEPVSVEEKRKDLEEDKAGEVEDKLTDEERADAEQKRKEEEEEVPPVAGSPLDQVERGAKMLLKGTQLVRGEDIDIAQEGDTPEEPATTTPHATEVEKKLDDGTDEVLESPETSGQATEKPDLGEPASADRKTDTREKKAKILGVGDKVSDTDKGRSGTITDISEGFVTTQWDDGELEKLEEEKFTILEDTGVIVPASRKKVSQGEGGDDKHESPEREKKEKEEREENIKDSTTAEVEVSQEEDPVPETGSPETEVAQEGESTAEPPVSESGQGDADLSKDGAEISSDPENIDLIVQYMGEGMSFDDAQATVQKNAKLKALKAKAKDQGAHRSYEDGTPPNKKIKPTKDQRVDPTIDETLQRGRKASTRELRLQLLKVSGRNRDLEKENQILKSKLLRVQEAMKVAKIMADKGLIPVEEIETEFVDLLKIDPSQFEAMATIANKSPARTNKRSGSSLRDRKLQVMREKIEQKRAASIGSGVRNGSETVREVEESLDNNNLFGEV